MWQPRFSISAVLLACSSLGISSFARAQAPPTIEQALASRGISSSVTSLRQALQDPRPDVRTLAANELAEKGDKEAIPLIRQALAKASSALEKQNFAQALITLGDPEGKSDMKSVCSDQTVQPDFRLLAASQLLDAGDNSCIDSVVELLSSTDNHVVRQGAMEFLRRSQSVPSNLLPDLEKGLVRALQDEIPSNRRSASERIAQFKIVNARDSLRKAISGETDSAARQQMELDLRKLDNE